MSRRRFRTGRPAAHAETMLVGGVSTALFTHTLGAVPAAIAMGTPGSSYRTDGSKLTISAYDMSKDPSEAWVKAHVGSGETTPSFYTFFQQDDGSYVCSVELVADEGLLFEISSDLLGDNLVHIQGWEISVSHAGPHQTNLGDGFSF